MLEEYQEEGGFEDYIKVEEAMVMTDERGRRRKRKKDK